MVHCVWTDSVPRLFATNNSLDVFSADIKTVCGTKTTLLGPSDILHLGFNK